MAGAKARARARARRKETEPLDLHDVPRGEAGSVARVRIMSVGRSTAARSGGTLQTNCSIRPVRESEHAEPRDRPEPPEVIYARPVWSSPVQRMAEPAAENASNPRRRPERARVAAVPTAVLPASRPSLAELQSRATHALAGLQAGLLALQHQDINLRKWSKSSIAWTAAVGAYAVALFLIALLTS